MLRIIAAVMALSACHDGRRTPLPAAKVPMAPVVDYSVDRGISAEPDHSQAIRTTDPPVNAPPVAELPVVDPIATINQQLKDVFFEYDREDLTPQAVSAVQGDARLLASILHDFPGVKVAIEGHCDERGSAEYNLALGDRRAASAAQALRNFGLADVKLETVTYGKESPQCTDTSESCWQKNRRAHIVVRE